LEAVYYFWATLFTETPTIAAMFTALFTPENVGSIKRCSQPVTLLYRVVSCFTANTHSTCVDYIQGGPKSKPLNYQKQLC